MPQIRTFRQRSFGDPVVVVAVAPVSDEADPHLVAELLDALGDYPVNLRERVMMLVS